MPHQYILAHDLGTTGDKATLFDERGAVIASSFIEYATRYPFANWAEQDPQDWWQAVCTSTRQLLADHEIARQHVAGISFSGQMQGCVLVDRQAVALRMAIIWADTRAVAEARSMADRVGFEHAYRIMGHRLSASYTAAKALWVANHQPELFRKSYKILQAKDYVIARLTGQFVTDHSDASTTNLYDLQARTWSQELLSAAGFAPGLLPDIHPSTDVVGGLTQDAADQTGLFNGTPVVLGGGDGACAAVGAGVVDAESAYTYLGSSAWIAVTSSEPVFDPQMRTVTLASLQPDRFCPLGVMQAAGGSYQWLRDTFCLPEKEIANQHNRNAYALMDELASQAQPGAGGLLFLPYLLGERSPYWNEKARGVFFGLTMTHGRSEIVRSVLEGVTFNLKIILDALQAQGVSPKTMRVIGGGAKSPVWRQIMADIYGLPVERPALLAEATSFGAALAGGIGVGFYPGFELAKQLTPVIETTLPVPSRKANYDNLYALFTRAYHACMPLYDEMERWK
jgi:xylulokinase